jgi:hypothetical protein
MDIFISWSGQRSKAVAELLKTWIKMVIQGTEPWISTQDLESGSLWLSGINDQLSVSATGIVCVTQENKAAPWIHFESGALAKGLTKARVCTFLIDLKPEDIANPLGQFNHTVPTRESMWKLVKSFNERLTRPSHLDEPVLTALFELFWPKFEDDFRHVLEQNKSTGATMARSSESYLVEILENTRALSQRVSAIEMRLEPLASRSTDDMTVVMLKKELERRLRVEERRTLENEEHDFSVNQSVFHQKFGNGRVVAIDGAKLDIEFDKAGLKRVLHTFVQTVEGG